MRYIDDLVLRERGNERLYSLADSNWNVVAIANASGIIQERMRYDAFGRITWLNAAFAVKGNSDFGWNRTFTGQVLDGETGMMLYRNRVYHAGLGRFVHRDPIEYLAGDVNLYRYVWNVPVDSLDPFGLDRNQRNIRVTGIPNTLAEIERELAKTDISPQHRNALEAQRKVLKRSAGDNRPDGKNSRVGGTARKVGKKLPFVGGLVSLAFWRDNVRAQGVVRGTLTTAYDASPASDVVDIFNDGREIIEGVREIIDIFNNCR